MSRTIRIKDPIALFLLLIVVAGLLGCQWMLSKARAEMAANVPPALAFVAIGMAIVALVVGLPKEGESNGNGSTEGSAPVGQLVARLTSQIQKNGRLVTLSASLLMVLMLLWRLPRKAIGESFGAEALYWAGAILLYVSAVVPITQISWKWRPWWRRQRKLALGVIVLILFAVLLRVWQLHKIPFALSEDEASQGLEAVGVISGRLQNPFSLGWRGIPSMSFFFNSVTIRGLGRSILALRLPWALVGATSVGIAFLLMKRLKGTTIALMTTLLLATYHYHIHFSRLGASYIATPFFMLLTMFFFCRALDGNRRLDWALMGIVVGLAFYFYSNAYQTLLIVFVVLVYQFIRYRRQIAQKQREGMIIALGALLITVAPIFQFSVRHPAEFSAMLDPMGNMAGGLGDDAAAMRGEGVSTNLADRLLRTALAFNVFADSSAWYGLPQPLLDPLFGSIFLLGLSYGTLRLFGRGASDRIAPMVAWWWSVVILEGLLNENPPASQRLISLSVPVCFFISLALSDGVRLARRGSVGVVGRAFLAIVAILFGFGSLVTYFLEYSPQRIFGGVEAELATEISPLLRENSTDHDLYFIGAPHSTYRGMATFAYLVPEAVVLDIMDPITDSSVPGIIARKEAALFIFASERTDELDALQRIISGGERREVRSPLDGRLLATLYEVSW